MIEIPLSTAIFEHYATRLAQNRRAASTVYRNRRILSRLEQWAHDRGTHPAQVTPLQMDQYVNSTLREGHGDFPALSSVSCHGHLVCIRAAFQWALDVDLIDGKNRVVAWRWMSVEGRSASSATPSFAASLPDASPSQNTSRRPASS
jgi:hypothetical protein